MPEIEARSGYHPALLPPQPHTPPLSHAIVKGKEPGRLCQMPRALGTRAILEWSKGGLQEEGLTIKASVDDLLGPGQLVLLSHLL